MDHRPWPAEVTCGFTAAVAAEHPAYVAARRALVVAGPDEDDAVLAAAAPAVPQLPVMVCVPEPTFARRLEAQVLRRVALLRRARVDLLTLVVRDTAELKAGGMLQVLFDLRARGVCREVGLAHADVRDAEWLALHTAARAIGLPWSLADQSARYRAAPTAAEHGMGCFAWQRGVTPDAVRFALAEAGRVLPVFDAPLPAGLAALPRAEVEASWAAYAADHAEPAKLPRSVPPE